MRLLKRSSTVVLLFTAGLHTAAQQESVVWGPLRDDWFTCFEHGQGDMTYVRTEHKKVDRIQALGADMTVQGEYIIPPEIPGLKSRGLWHPMIFLKDRAVIIVETWNKLTCALYAQPLSLDQLKPLAPMKKLDEVTAPKKQEQIVYWLPERSGDNQFTVVRRVKDDDTQRRHFLEFSNELEPLDTQGGLFTEPYVTDDIVASCETENGSIAIYTKPLSGSQASARRKAGAPEHELIWVANRADLPKPIENHINDRGHHLERAKLHRHGDDFVLCGYYNAEQYKPFNGTFVMRFDQDGNEKSAVFSGFPDAFVVDQMSERRATRILEYAERKDKELLLANHKFRAADLWEDGSAVLISEFETKSVGQSMDQYLNKEVKMVCHGPDGKVRWATTIPKTQLSRNDFGEHNSIALLSRPDGIAMFYNTSDSIDLPAFRITTVYGHSRLDGRQLVVAHVDANGDVTKYALPNPGNGDTMMVPHYSKPINGHTMGLVAKYNGKFRIGKCILDNP